MDTPKELTHVSICAGYAGIDLGLKRAIHCLRTVAFSEIEAFVCANLVAKMEAGLLDPAPIWTNLKTFPWGRFRDRVDLLSGGYPCQPFSGAGKRLGADDPRHLWPFIADGIRLMRPKLVFFENVEGHVTLGLPEVLQELWSMGYHATWGIFSASEVGASHQRKRVFILAHHIDTRLQRYAGNVIERGESGRLQEGSPGSVATSRLCGGVWPSRPGQRQFRWEPPRVLAPTEDERPGEARGLQPNGPKDRASRDGQACEPLDCEAQPEMGGDADGPPHRMDTPELYLSCDSYSDELWLLGNGVVPECAERAFRTLWDELNLI